MTVLHIVSSVSRNAGGPARSVQGLVAAQCVAGIDAWLMTLRDLGDPWVDGIPNYRCAKCSGARGVRAAVEKVIDECKPDLIEVHSLWQTNLHQAVVAARSKGIPYILTPRGCLDIWSLQQKWLKKKLALLTYQGYDLRKAIAIHTTSDEESRQVRRLGYGQPLLQFPNGVNLPAELPTKNRVGAQRRMLFLSRMHPKKGVLDLVEAWHHANPKGWICELVYSLGYDAERQYEQQVKQRILDLGMSYQDKDGTIHSPTTTSDYDFIFTGSLDDDAKWAAYRRADCFILPTHTENFGIVVAEALWAGVPVITTKGAPWKELEEFKCGWWIDDNVDALTQALKEALSRHCTTTASDYDSLSQMGERGRALVTERYTWPAVCDRIVEAYEVIAKSSTIPVGGG